MNEPVWLDVAAVSDLAALEAAYAFAIVRNRPFIDGNERAAFGSMIVFLGQNDIDFLVPPEERHGHDPFPCCW